MRQEMQINSGTKIADLIKFHPDALEAIISLSPDFKKLRNPILRRLMAGRTSISMASKIGGCKPEDFFEILKPLGFVSDNSIQEQEVLLRKSLKDFVKDIETAHIIPLDVRAMLAEGNDPLRLIQQYVKELKEGQVLKIINTFEPTPLIKLLEKQGFESYVDQIEKNLIETYFYRNKPAEINQAIPEGVESDWNQLLKQYDNKMIELDVRHLEMPGPMMAILEELEKLDYGKALYVHHKRIPVFLLSELKDRNFEYRINEISGTEVYLLIFKK
ncbi:MAG: DUF2249 domain-containing protein [Daejeonella sp.]|uniref:DUF2249 domain-containing protein n=1 Tax=Daejeonella sp. TaxID=2805397 RepID=UPI002732A9B0|nr:DUF2249 domain-containing protein [Daejeonella sp.]MDP3468139.1 DUF2249 domain-containing protein [Daejeonella sp.]